jgi:hypothetical protein
MAPVVYLFVVIGTGVPKKEGDRFIFGGAGQPGFQER